MHTHRLSTAGVGIRLTPEKFARNFAIWCAARSITDDASLSTWVTANITTLAQARGLLVDLITNLTDFVPPNQQ